jgi:hypothetical protein
MMNKKFRIGLAVSLPALLFTSCSSLTRCFNGTKSKTANTNFYATNKSVNNMEETQACPKCGKNSCDASCNSNQAADSTGEGKYLKELVPSCNLSETQMVSRKAELTDKYSLFQKVDRVVEMKDGYDLVFVQPKDFSYKLLDFINFERNCCSNFSFALEFEPNEKASHLKIYGSKAIKEELKNGFTELGVIRK